MILCGGESPCISVTWDRENNVDKALIASTDSKIREIAQNAFQSEKLDAVLCGDGSEVLESLKELGAANVRLIVLEAFLPKVDGFEVVRRLAEFPVSKETPALMIIPRSGASAEPHLRIRLNADDYLEKPFEAEELRQKIHSMVKYYRPHEAPHPVTGLLGHPQFENEVFTRLSRGDRFATVWLDINHFRPFNDHYGRDKGNAVIKKVAELIRKTLGGKNSDSVPIAHVDGDDFVILVPQENAQAIADELKSGFDGATSEFYSAEEKKRGFYYEKGRDQKDQIFPLMTLSTVVLNVSMEKFRHYGQLVSQAGDLLHQAKVGS